MVRFVLARTFLAKKIIKNNTSRSNSEENHSGHEQERICLDGKRQNKIFTDVPARQRLHDGVLSLSA